MRRKLYFVIFPPQETQELIKATLLDVYSKSPLISWSKKDIFHIPITFLGAVSKDGQDAAIEAAENVFPQIHVFEISIGQLSYFYKIEKQAGSAIFLEVFDPEKTFKNLHKLLSKSLSEKGFSPATRFTPHIIVGKLERQRFDHKQKRILYDLTQIEIKPSKPFLVDTVYLVESFTDNIFTQEFTILRTFTLGK